MASHAIPDPLGPAGAVGVTVFFVLSGFLITALLLEEHEHRGQISFGGFYARRARRLLPALVVMVTVVAVVDVAVDVTTPGGIVAALFYFANLAKAHGSSSLGALGHTWSLSVEEQFYLLWPLAVVAASRYGRRAVGILAAAAFRVLAWDGPSSYYLVRYSSMSQFDALLLGCLLAVAMPLVARWRPVLPAVVLLAGVVAWCAADGWWLVVVAPAGVAVLTVGLIVAVLERPGWLGGAWLQWCGRRSYGLYLWHYPVAVFLQQAAPGLPWWASAGVVLTVPFLLAEA